MSADSSGLRAAWASQPRQPLRPSSCTSSSACVCPRPRGLPTVGTGAQALPVRRCAVPAPAGDLHEEVTERIVELLDVPQHSRVAASCGADPRRVHAVPAQAQDCMAPVPAVRGHADARMSAPNPRERVRDEEQRGRHTCRARPFSSATGQNTTNTTQAEPLTLRRAEPVSRRECVLLVSLLGALQHLAAAVT